MTFTPAPAVIRTLAPAPVVVPGPAPASAPAQAIIPSAANQGPSMDIDELPLEHPSRLGNNSDVPYIPSK